MVSEMQAFSCHQGSSEGVLCISSESELKVMKEELSAQIETMSKVIADKLSFNDSREWHVVSA